MSSKNIDTNTDGRTKEFSRNELLERLLKDVNDNLWDSEERLLSGYSGSMKMPLIFIMGPMRSGTTLFMQWLANTGLVSYPTNLLSRFYQAPIIGSKIQQLLTDSRFSFRNELGEFIQQSEYRSENGKTRGVLAPNEFWYFWRRFLAEPSRDVWTNEELRLTMDIKTMKAEIIGIMDVFQNPFAAKGMLFNYNIPFLDSIFDKILFIQIKRDILTNISSVLDTRKRQFGSESNWYSFKIPEYSFLKRLDPITQTAGQIYYINEAVKKGLEKVDDKRKMVVQYEDFCLKPRQFFDDLVMKLELDRNNYIYSGEECFKKSRENDVPNRQIIEKAISQYQ
ncbi:MAG: sulfotransferase [Candidatus Thiodiazotropha sp. (ex Myrtea sp. 'scaly one' KF741663)]|nr:sulfotransferase [Candidatus Thiodiazotropha sp. (ex Myrtea sp. 'scaly one' KF741663)]